MTTTMGDAFHYVDRVYRLSRTLALDVGDGIRHRSGRSWSQAEGFRYVESQGYTWGESTYTMAPWGVFAWQSTGPYVALVLRFYSRVWTHEPMVMLAVAPPAELTPSSPGWFLEEGLRRGEADVAPSTAHERLMDITLDRRDTFATWRAFAVSLDRLKSAHDVRRRLVEPAVALVDDDLEAVAASLDLADPARVLLAAHDRDDTREGV